MKLPLTIAITACIGALIILPGGTLVSAQAPAGPGPIPMPIAPKPIPGNTDYVVAQGASVSELVLSVKALQAKGYSCQGGMATAISPDGSGWLYQPMVR